MLGRKPREPTATSEVRRCEDERERREEEQELGVRWQMRPETPWRQLVQPPVNDLSRAGDKQHEDAGCVEGAQYGVLEAVCKGTFDFSDINGVPITEFGGLCTTQPSQAPGNAVPPYLCSSAKRELGFRNIRV